MITTYTAHYTDGHTFQFKVLSQSEGRKLEAVLEPWNHEVQMPDQLLDEKESVPSQAQVDYAVSRIFAEAGL